MITQTELFIARKSGIYSYCEYDQHILGEIVELINAGKVKLDKNGFVVYYTDKNANPPNNNGDFELFKR